MIQIRSNVFETNSSSTHSICISKKEPKIGSYVDFHLGYFGWENDKVNPANYLYTAIMCRSDSDELLNKLKEILDKNGIMYDFEEPEYDSHGWMLNGYIDHNYETNEFVDTVLDNEDMLMRLLFNLESVVYTGNDNEDGDNKPCNAAAEYKWFREDGVKFKGDGFDDWIEYYNGGKWVRKKVGNWDNSYYDPDNFDYFYKDN